MSERPGGMAEFAMISNRNLRAHRIAGLEAGPRLIVTGAVHGNETAGTKGIRRVLAEIDNSDIEIVRGSVTFVPVCNPLAYNNIRRMGDRNLNRRLVPKSEDDPSPRDFEDRIAAVLCPWLAEHDVLLDLHSFRSPGRPFVMRGPADNSDTLEPFAHAAAEARLAAHVGPNRIVEGWMSAYADGVARRKARGLTPGAVHEDPSYGVGTTEYMRSQGGYGVTLECGQHDDPMGAEVAYQRHPPDAGAARPGRVAAGATGSALRMPAPGRSGGPPRRRRPLRQDMDQLRPAGRGRADRRARRWLRAARSAGRLHRVPGCLGAAGA